MSKTCIKLESVDEHLKKKLKDPVFRKAYNKEKKVLKCREAQIEKMVKKLTREYLGPVGYTLACKACRDTYIKMLAVNLALLTVDMK